jgi:hypothetical protein
MNEIVKNEYTEIQKYFDDYYKEQLEVYEEKKYFDNYLLTELTDEPIYWLSSFLALLVTAILAEKNKSSDFSTFLNFIFFVVLGIIIILTILICFKAIFYNWEFEKSKKRFFKHFYKSKNIKKVTTDLGVNKKDLTFDEDNIIIGLNIKDEKRLSKIERELKNGK